MGVMRTADHIDDIDLHSLPKFQRALRHAALLGQWLLAGGVLSTLVLWLLWRELWLDGRPALVTLLAMLLVLLAGLQSIWWLTRWRARALKTMQQAHAHAAAIVPMTEADAQVTTPQSHPRRATRWKLGLQRRGKLALQIVRQHLSVDAAAAIGMALFASAALLLVIHYWHLPSVATPTGTALTYAPTVIFAAAVTLLAFALLVMERYSAAHLQRELPEAIQLAYLLRVAISVSILLGAASLLSGASRQWPMTALTWIGLLPGMIAIEYLLRALLSVFTPPQHEPELLAENLIAGMWRWPLQPFKNFQDELKQRFGIDLRQSWAFAYIRSALLPVLTILLGIAWLLSSIIEVPLDSRAIYERFGKPVAVFSPGLHLGWPWPMARLRLVENGVVHELATASARTDGNGDAQQTKVEAEVATAEGQAPVSANRLWDASHVAEKSQLIASQTNSPDGRQSFQIVNMDVRFMYRIGLSDTDALNATYNSNGVPTLVRSTANQVLVSYFASRTLEGVLGEGRTPLAAEIGAQVQQALRTLNSGVEIMATVIEAIHPPAAAANAYHSVQAAQISAQAIIARERGSAAEQVNLAQLRAGMALDQANASKRETVATAEVVERRFAAERTAYKQAGKAFLLEQYFGQLTAGLNNAQLVVIDHRLRAPNATIDLRNVAAPLDGAFGTGQRRSD